MKLIKVETKGFKSFAERIILNFNGDVAAIVGPNGSGKSNINDAIKWVLGEQSLKQLRGNQATDIIFAGSKSMPAAQKAEVSLTFDNHDPDSKIPHQKVVITRRVTRNNSSNQYFINGENARLKDIKEIAMESGIGKSSLAIIGQGTISDIAEATPENRRFVFEEAAGISKYKARKQEALRKLNVTNEALDKVRTITKELAKQVGPLKRQAEKAQLFLAKKAELKQVELGLIASDLVFFGKQLKALNSELEEVFFTNDNLKQKIAEVETKLEEKNQHKYQLENEVQKLQVDLQTVVDQMMDIDLRNKQAAHHRQLIMEGKIQASNSQKISTIKAELNDLNLKLKTYHKWITDSEKVITAKKAEITSAKVTQSKLDFATSDLKQKSMQIKTKLTLLKDFRDNKSNLFTGTKTIMQNQQVLPGIKGIVADILTVPQPYQNAVETVLGNILQNVVVNTPDDAVQSIKFLKANQGGRATFIPLATIKPKGIREEHINIAATLPGYVDVLANLVTVKPEFVLLNRFLLGHIILADQIEQATTIAQTLNNLYMVVTPAGDLIRTGGIISGGQSAKSKALLGNEEQIAQLEQAIPLVEAKLKTNAQQLNGLLNTISENNAVIAELSIEIASVRDKRQNTQKLFDSLKVTYEAQSKEKFVLDKVSVESSFEKYQSEKASITALVKAKRESIIELNNDLAVLTSQKTEFDKALRTINTQSASKIKAKTEAEFVIQAHTKRLAEEYEMTIDHVQNNFALDLKIDQARQEVDRLRAEIKAIGNVNLDALTVFKEVNARYEKYTTSEEELFAAQQKIVAAINEMDKIIIAKLDATVQDVNIEFNRVFAAMFGGGFAEIKYTLPHDLLETGIDVVASPPGKTVKNLRLFSGGEKAMIAISLLFAVLKSRPLPLCILDEVEAPLDETNVERFADYLQELKAQTQFIVITHRFGTMARVDTIFGATMQNKGSTSFFTVKLEEAKKYIEE